MVGHLSRFITDDTGFNVANMKWLIIKISPRFRNKNKKVDSRFRNQQVWILYVQTEKKEVDSNEQYPIEEGTF
jgi:hypothetical protein